MRIAEVIGAVTLCRCHPSFQGATLKLIRPLTLEDLRKDRHSSDGEMVVWDVTGAGLGDRIALSEGGEAAQPFRPDMKPVDAYAAALLDQINLD